MISGRHDNNFEFIREYIIGHQRMIIEMIHRFRVNSIIDNEITASYMSDKKYHTTLGKARNMDGFENLPAHRKFNIGMADLQST